jgi:glycosyltransferase involved in cell wall biosynthesis
LDPVWLASIGAFGAAYSYFLYPLLLLLLPDAKKGEHAAQPHPRLSLVITAHNEEQRIRAKLASSVALRSQFADLQILVASDASTDATDAIVGEFAGDGVVLVRTEHRKGKEWAQRAAIEHTSGDVIVFTDVGATIEPPSIARLADLFGDRAVGAVSSVDRLVAKDGEPSGEGLYVRYEMWLRDLESRKGGLIGLSGSFFATRRIVCELWDTDIPSDFSVAINCRLLGLKAICDHRVVGVYEDVRDPDAEFGRKVRTVIRGVTALAKKARVLNPVRYGKFAFQIWSHKLMRWAVPWFMLVYVCSAIALFARSPWYAALLAPIVLLLGLAGAGALARSSRKMAVVNASHYFVQVNAAIFVATVQFFAGRRVTTWAPTKR